MAKATNHLASSLSPYLLQHQHNPVDWYPWGEEALQRAKREDKPIFLSIGYSACHWCHVMERESFEDPKIAELLNPHFVCIKADREERPDLDRIYLSCVQAMTGRGGWPLSVFLTPDLKPFFGGTYFPPERRYGIPGFQTLLTEIIRVWKENRSTLVTSSEKLFQSVVQEEELRQKGDAPLSEGLLEKLVEVCQRDYDSRWGGFGKAPKFPQTGILSALMRRHSKTGEMITHTLHQMARGGIYDQMGGGFHRYSVDERWLIPHFEKMLSDNALLSHLYLDAYLLTRQQPFLDLALQTLDYLLREMRHPLGGFYSAEDADSEGEEGTFYLWTDSEIKAVVSNPSLFCRVFGVTSEGNFEGKNILSQAVPLSTLHREEREKLTSDARALLSARARRIKPALSDQVLADWNALAISSLAKAYQVTGQTLYLEAAHKTVQFIESHLVHQEQLFHVWRQIRGATPGFLEDYANYLLALLDLYECDFNLLWLKRAKELLQTLIELFWDPKEGAFYATSLQHNSPLIRKKEFHDTATPSGNAQAALALLRLSSYYDEPRYQQMAERILSAQAAMMEKVPQGYGAMLCAVDSFLSSMQQIVIVGELNHPKTRAFLRAIYNRYLPHRVLALCDGEAAAELPLCKDKAMEPGHAFVCYQGRCSPATSDPKQLISLLLDNRLNSNRL